MPDSRIIIVQSQMQGQQAQGQCWTFTQQSGWEVQSCASQSAAVYLTPALRS